jgi:6-pyruvoyltetrahydropterin/6-carboxytetrahydropterin synthase
MKITTLKRFEFAAARRLAGQWHGDNFVVWVGVAGPLDPRTGMVINVSDLKAAAATRLDEKYDHRLLDVQIAEAPTTLNIARALWADLRPDFRAPQALASVDVQEQEGPAARVEAGSAPTGIVVGEFSAAHRTHAPGLSAAENRARYGICNNPAGHGHNYRAALYLPEGAAAPAGLWAEFDHRNLSADIAELQGRNVVTETLAELIARRVPEAGRVRVWETSAFFADYRRAGDPYALGRRYHFSAAHRLNSPALSPEVNARLFGKCNRADPHGHTYQVEVVLTVAALDPQTETAHDLDALDRCAADIVGPLDHRYLDAEVAFFHDRPSTGENIALYLWERFAGGLGPALESVRVWETPNNQFVVQR